MHETPRGKTCSKNPKGFPGGGAAPEGGSPTPLVAYLGPLFLPVRCASSAEPPQCGGLCCLLRSPPDFVQPAGCSSPQASSQAPGLQPPQGVPLSPGTLAAEPLVSRYSSAPRPLKPQGFRPRRQLWHHRERFRVPRRQVHRDHRDNVDFEFEDRRQRSSLGKAPAALAPEEGARSVEDLWTREPS